MPDQEQPRGYAASSAFLSNPLDPNTIAADYLVAALGRERSNLALAALRAGWLTPDEAGMLEPLAAAVARMIGVELPEHRGNDAAVRRAYVEGSTWERRPHRGDRG